LHADWGLVEQQLQELLVLDLLVVDCSRAARRGREDVEIVLQVGSGCATVGVELLLRQERVQLVGARSSKQEERWYRHCRSSSHSDSAVSEPGR